MDHDLADIRNALKKPVVLIGLMGAGKTRLGGMLADALNVPFIDSDREIEKSAGCTVPEIFSRYGEPSFRDLERKVMERLLTGEVCVIATGGGAVMSPETAARIWERSVSIWLDADFDILESRVSRNTRRPLLAGGNARDILVALMQERRPVYEQADIRIDTGGADMNATIRTLLSSLSSHLQKKETA